MSLILIGLALAVGGVALIRYGGSFSYVLASFAATLSGALLLRSDGRGRWAFGAILVGMLVSEVVPAAETGDRPDRRPLARAITARRCCRLLWLHEARRYVGSETDMRIGS